MSAFGLASGINRRTPPFRAGGRVKETDAVVSGTLIFGGSTCDVIVSVRKELEKVTLTLAPGADTSLDVTFTNVAPSGLAAITSSVAIPAAFRPTEIIYIPIVLGSYTGRMQIAPAGGISFTISGTAGESVTIDPVIPPGGTELSYILK